MKHTLRFLPLFSLLFFGNILLGQEKLTFNDCLKIAFENNLALKNAAFSEKIAEYQLTNSKVKLLPEVNASIGNNYSWGRGIDPNTNSYINQQFKSYNGNIGSSLKLFNGFSNLIAIKSAKQELELNKGTIQKIKNDITIDIASKFTTVLYMQETIKSNKEQLVSSQRQLELVENKFHEGYVAESEVFKIKSQKASEELTLINNQNILDTNLLDLKQLLNLPLDEIILLVEPSEKIFSKIELSLTETANLDMAINKNPYYIISKINEKKAELNISSIRSAVFPTLSTGFNLGSTFTDNNTFSTFKQQLNNNLFYGLTFTLSIPIFSQLSTHYNIKESKLTFEKAKVDSEIERNRLLKVILQAVNDANASFSKYESSVLSYEFSKKSYEADTLKFELGKISTNEILLSKNNFTNAQAQSIQAKYELIYNQGVINFYMNQKFSIDN